MASILRARARTRRARCQVHARCRANTRATPNIKWPACHHARLASSPTVPFRMSSKTYGTGFSLPPPLAACSTALHRSKSARWVLAARVTLLRWARYSLGFPCACFSLSECKARQSDELFSSSHCSLACSPRARSSSACP